MDKNCEQHKCCKEESKGNYDTGCEMSDQMLQMADDAWESLLKKKIEAKFEAQMGEHMEKIAEALANGSMALHGGQMKHKNETEEVVKKIKESFSMG